MVVEASLRSGAIISAQHAMEQNRDVFAVPGRVDSRASHGCHQLIRDGAYLTEKASDVIETLGPLVESTTNQDGHTIRRPAELQLTKQEREVLDAIGVEPTNIDEVIVKCGIPVHRVLSTISVLEMRHLVKRVSGSQVIRA